VRQLLQLRQERLLQLTDPRPILVPTRADVEGDDPRRIETGVDASQVVVAAQQQGRRSDQQHAQRHLSDDERLLQPVTSAGDRAAAIGEARAQPRSCAGQRGNHAEGERGE
jgi:hypothetical protein